MNYDINEIKKMIDGIFQETVDIRRHIHQNPELSQMEKNTSKFVCERLSQLGIEHEDTIAGYGLSLIHI